MSLQRRGWSELETPLLILSYGSSRRTTLKKPIRKNLLNKISEFVKVKKMLCSQPNDTYVIGTLQKFGVGRTWVEFWQSCNMFSMIQFGSIFGLKGRNEVVSGNNFLVTMKNLQINSFFKLFFRLETSANVRLKSF